jgi:hypothetical protein
VHHKIEEEEKATEREPQQWKEVVEDIWEHYLPQFTYTGEGYFLYDAAAGRYLFQSESGSEEDYDLMGGEEEMEDCQVLKDEPPLSTTSLISAEAFVEQEQPDMEQGIIGEVVEQEQPDMEQRIIGEGAGKKSLALAQQAAQYTPEQVAQFLKSIGLGQYSERFLENNVSGDMIIEMEDADLAEIGSVESRLHQVKIITLFKTLIVGGSPTSLSLDDIADYLEKQQLDTFVDTFRANCIDGELLEAILARKQDKVMVEGNRQMSVTDLILKELGMTEAKQRVKLKSKIGIYTASLMSARS